MGDVFKKTFEAGWRHVDPNGHVANMVYLEYAVDTRVSFFATQGFQPDDFTRYGFGPVIKSDFVEYFSEVRMLDKLSVTMENGGHSEDGSRFRVINNIYKEDGKHAVRITSIGGWLHLENRKLIEPPEQMKNAWLALERSSNFEELPSSIKK